MTESLRGNDGSAAKRDRKGFALPPSETPLYSPFGKGGGSGCPSLWIPAYAGMTGACAE